MPGETVFEESGGSPPRIVRDRLPLRARNHEPSGMGTVGVSGEPEIQAGEAPVVATNGAEAVEGPSVVVRADDGSAVDRRRKTRDGGRKFVGNDPKHPPRRAAGKDALGGRVARHGTQPEARGKARRTDRGRAS